MNLVILSKGIITTSGIPMKQEWSFFLHHQNFFHTSKQSLNHKIHFDHLNKVRHITSSKLFLCQFSKVKIYRQKSTFESQNI